jgi:ParB family transcriptional regulator, chromosome partitioning protein
MELRRVDPRALKKSPSNPRKIQPGEMSDATLAASIKAVGILQPPTVSEKDGALTIVYGARRVRLAIDTGLQEIDVLVKDPDEDDHMRAVSENVVRAPMATVDLWRAIESLASENWTEEAIGAALAIPVRQIRKLRLLATVHPAILDQIGAGDMPKEQELRTIASASREDQAAVWKKLKPRKHEGAQWWQINQALQKTRFFARDAKFGEDERAAFGIVWQEDLFAEGDEDNRFTIDGEAFISAQRAWLDANMPKNGILLETDSYGHAKLPPRANRTWTKPKRGDQIGYVINPRDGSIEEIAFRVSKPEVKAPRQRGGATAVDEAPAPKKTRPEITHKGTEIIGALRTEALVKSFGVEACEDVTLIGLLILGLGARNVNIQTKDSTHATREKLVQSITEGGRLTQDAERLRVVARQMLASVLSCSLGHGDSGLVARIAGETLGADAHLPDMANEDFLGCLSKAGIERVASSLGVLPRPRVKETQAEVIKQASGSTFVHSSAHFALNEAEIALHQEPPRAYSWESAGGADDPSDDERIEGEHDAGSGAQPVGDEAGALADDEDGAELEGEEEKSPSLIAPSRRSRRRQAEAA